MERKERERRYREAHPEKIKAKSKKYWETHREHILERARLQRAPHREEIREKMRLYRATHRERVRESQRRWRRLNPEKYKAIARIHNHRRKWSTPLIFLLNKYFIGSRLHHVERSIGVYIPDSLHLAIPHNLKTGKGMIEINEKVSEWLAQGGKSE